MREVNDLYCRPQQDVDLRLNIYNAAHLLHSVCIVQHYYSKDLLCNCKQAFWRFKLLSSVGKSMEHSCAFARWLCGTLPSE